MHDAPQTMFRFTTEGVDLEFAGTETFVEQQVTRFRKFLEGAVGIIEGAELAEALPDVPRESLADFYAARPVREGRGAIQDRILLFIYYLEKIQGKREVTGDDINACFDELEIEKPKNLHNTLGILKRKVGHLGEGSRRGLYQLSDEGRSYLEGRFKNA